MTTELHPEILSPPHTYVLRLAAMGLGCGLIGASIMVAAAPARVVQAPPITLTETVTVPMMVSAESMPVPSRSSFSLVFEADGASYMKLADAPKKQRHGALTMSTGSDYAVSAVALVADADLPAAHRVWKNREVIVDGTCRTTVTGFAIVARVTGETSYSSESAADAEGGWTAKHVLQEGSPILAAQLAGCRGGEIARDAALPTMITPTPIVDKALAKAATRRLFASADAKAAAREWAAYEADAGMEPGAPPYGEHQTIIVRHPVTGITYVSVHATTGGTCGTPEISLWGLYRVESDRSLARMPSAVGQLLSIEKLVDVDGDGQLEVVGRPWLGVERMVNRVTGATLEQLVLPFFGCAC